MADNFDFALIMFVMKLYKTQCYSQSRYLDESGEKKLRWSYKNRSLRRFVYNDTSRIVAQCGGCYYSKVYSALLIIRLLRVRCTDGVISKCSDQLSRSVFSQNKKRRE